MSKFIEDLNNAYYNSEEPLVSDKEFDLLSDTGLETTNFRKKVQHHNVMGSLSKLKNSVEYTKWIENQPFLEATAKLDGNSIELIFMRGDLIYGITRGNGYLGNDVTDKIKHCNIMLPKGVIKKDNIMSLKCEAIMKKSYQKDYDKNIRNVVSGLLNRKSVIPEELNKIDIIPFDILHKYTYTMVPSYDVLCELFEKLKSEFEYDIDGLVIEKPVVYTKGSNELLPDNKAAVKFNKGGVETKIGSIEWNIGKYARLTPVLILNPPVDIDGSTVSRVSASNYKLLKAAGLGIGAEVEVIKAGEIIPYISKVNVESYTTGDINCPVCGAKSVELGVNMICPNETCPALVTVFLQNIFSILEIDYISDKIIEKLVQSGYNTLSKIYNMTESDFVWIDGFGEKLYNTLRNGLKNIKLKEYQILEMAMLPGFSKTQSKKLVDHFGSIKNIIPEQISQIDGFGMVLQDTLVKNFSKVLDMKLEINALGFTMVKEETKMNKQKVVFTGACSQYGRKELTNVLEEKGFEVQSSLKKDTDILLCETLDSSSSKMKKAKDNGTKVIVYADFFQEINL